MRSVHSAVSLIMAMSPLSPAHCCSGGRDARAPIACLRLKTKCLWADEDLLAGKFPGLWVPREENDDRGANDFVRRLHAQPYATMSAGHLGHFENALRPDHDVGQAEFH